MYIQEARKHAAEVAGSQAPLDRMDIYQMEREAAEGQEVEPAAASVLLTSPLPLELLLAQTENSGRVGELR